MNEGATAARRVIIHQDDIGMCHGANQAFLDLFPLGQVGAGSVMVPCPWFLEIAQAAANDPSLDLGVHLTLNSEMQLYKWRPLTSPSRAAGLTDDNGYLWSDVASTRRHCHPDAAEAEMRAQVDRALANGVDVTHLDAHMGSTFAPEFCDAYVRLGRDYRLPILLTPTLSVYSARNHLEGADEAPFNDAVALARELGFVLVDLVLETDWHRTASAEETYQALYSSIQPGLTYMAMHFTAPGEIESIERGTSHIRTDEYALFRSESFRQWLDAQGFELLGMRALRDDLRARLS
jgi:chitin disaccharide deacetylase